MKTSAINKLDLGTGDPASKVKKARLSEPNAFPDDLGLNVTKKKEQPHSMNTIEQRKPRISQIYSPSSTLQIWGSPRFYHEVPRPGYMSPTYTREPKLMIKSPSVSFIHAETQPVKLLPKTFHTAPQQKIKKSPIQSHKQTLNKIEQMLQSHGISIQPSKDKKQPEGVVKAVKKSPRLSQTPFGLNQFKFAEKRKQASSYGNSRKTNEPNQNETKDMKQTISTHSSMKKSKQIKISEFQLYKQIGKGKFGVVRLAIHKKTGLAMCIKIIKKSIIKKQQILQQLIKQIKIQTFLNQPNIIKLYSIFDDSQNIYLLLQLCTDGNLYQYMQKKRRIQQPQARLVLHSVAEGLAQLHQYRITHRDLKPQNIVLCYGVAKICDFGWSTQIKQTLRQTFCGTPLYVSPQLLTGNSYDEKVDLWAIGVLAFEMLTGKTPFDIRSEKQMSKIVYSKVVYPKSMSSEAVDFLEQLLDRDPEKRSTVIELLEHPFLQRKKNK